MNEWKYTLNLSDVFHNDELTLSQKTTSIVSRIKRSTWYYEANYNGDLEMLLEELQDSADDDAVDWWDSTWGAFYDIADAERVWVKTR